MKIRCFYCGHSYEEANANDPRPCPACGQRETELVAEGMPEVPQGHGVRETVPGSGEEAGELDEGVRRDVGLPLRSFVAHARRDWTIKIAGLIQVLIEDGYKAVDPGWGTAEKCSICGFCLCRGCHDEGPCKTIVTHPPLYRRHPLFPWQTRWNYSALASAIIQVEPMPPSGPLLYVSVKDKDDDGEP